MSTSCLLTQGECPSLETISAYPSQGITPSHLHWSPDGTQALILDTYTPRILRLEAKGVHLTTLLDDVLTISDDLLWLPNGRPVFVVQGTKEYTSQLVTLTGGEESPRLRLLADFDGIAYLLGTDSLGRILLSSNVYGFPEATPSVKEVVVQTKLLAVDPVTGQVTEPWPQDNWLVLNPQSILPDERHLIVGLDSLGLWDLQSGEMMIIGSHLIWPVGSPDNRWLAMIAANSDRVSFTTQVMDIKTGRIRTLAQLPVSSRLAWTPDSRYVIMYRLGIETSATLKSMRVVAVEDGLTIIPPIDLGEYPVIEDVSWGP